MRICFWGNITQALDGNTAGGAELQIALLAKSLAIAGHEVIVIDPFTNESIITPEGISIKKIENWNSGIRGLRLFLNRIPSFLRLLIEIKADYYYVRQRSYFHILAFIASKKNKAGFIQAIACDIDTSGTYKKIKEEYISNFNLIKYIFISLPNDLVFQYLLTRSNIILFQHSGQQLFKAKPHQLFSIFPNIIDASAIPFLKSCNGNYFVHVGSISILKGARNLLKLISSLCPTINILIVGKARDKASQKIVNEISTFNNVDIKGKLGHKETINLISNAKALINTSNYEGFPNIFLEAWSAGVPVISLNINPGMIFSNSNLGYYCKGNYSLMKEQIESFQIDSFNRNEMKQFVSDFHAVEKSATLFESIIDKYEMNNN
jgi:glycosyltransferase involved in cell wall biosynthesis